MPRRLLGASLLALIALTAPSPRSFAKPPDLPDNPTIIVQHPAVAFAAPQEWPGWLPEAILLNIHPLMTFHPAGHFTPCDKHACALADVCATRTVLDNLKALRKADRWVRKAKKLIERQELDKAAECLAEAVQLCPGSPCAAEAEALRNACLARTKADEEKAPAEEADEPSGGCSTEPIAGCLRGMQQMGLCRFTAARELFGCLTAEPARCEAACLPGVEGKLCLPVSVHFVSTPLEMALGRLLGGFGVPFVVDEDARGTRMDRPVSLHLEHMPLRHVIEMMVRPIGLHSVVKGGAVHITRAAPDSCGMPARGEEACEPCPKAQRMHEERCAATKAQVDGLIKACYLAVEAKCYAKAAELARQAHALDPARVEADPLVYKMHLLAGDGPKDDEPAIQQPTGCPPGAAGEGTTGSLMFGVGINSDAGLTGSVVGGERAAYRADEKAAGAEGAFWRALGAFVMQSYLIPVVDTDQRGSLTFGLWPAGVNLHCKAPCKDHDVHIVIRGYLPLIWATPAKAE